MNKIFPIFALIVLLDISQALATPAVQPCWYGKPDFSKHMGCFESQGNGSLRVKSSHLRRLGFDGDFAIVFDKQHGWMYVNKKGEVVVKGVARIDNWADEISEGFVRYQSEKKCGYANLSDPSATIVPQFDGCLPFNDGEAQVCIGCQSKLVGEVFEWSGGEYYSIDTKGQRLKEESSDPK